MGAMPVPGLALFGLLALSPDGGSDLKGVLQKLGEDARTREEAAACSYKEATTVEELGPDGGVLGSELRSFDVEVKAGEVTRRDLVAVTKSGAPLADLLQQQRNTKGKKPARSPLHPDSQSDYRFELKDGPGPDQQTLSIEPLKPSADRVRGEAVLSA